MATKYNFTVNSPGTNNAVADALSRFQMVKFRQLALAASQRETQIPLQAWII